MTDNISVEIRFTSNPGAVKAYADVHISFSEGCLDLYGFSVISKDSKPEWVGFPAKAGNTQGKFFPVVQADGELREQISKAVLAAYRNTKR
jgi:hypothetical protein